MATLKLAGGIPTPSRPTLERREQALERLPLAAVTLLPESPHGDAADLVSEAAFWLDYQPRGARAPYTSPELRLGAQAVEERRLMFEDELHEGALVARKPGAAPKVVAKRARKRRASATQTPAPEPATSPANGADNEGGF